MLADQPLTIRTLLSVFRRQILLTWFLILCETTLLALIPLFISYAIDGLLAGSMTALFQLSGIMAGLILLSVLRRLYDTRVYGTIRVEAGLAQTARASDLPVSKLNARLGMGRELVDFLETTLPEAMGGFVQLIISVAILYSFAPQLALSGIAAATGMLLIYALFHRRFYRLNSQLNHQVERQVGILDTRVTKSIRQHLTRLRKQEIRLSDSEAILYGLIFLLLLAFVVCNLWLATTQMVLTPGKIFAVISYSWEFVESALALPIILQSWSRLSEIMQRLND